MPVVVKGMEMPENCWECTESGLNVGVSVFGGICPFCVKIVEDHNIKTGRHPDCPLDAYQDESSHSLIFGYPLEYLVAFAEACRRANVDESDLKTFANNCTFAYATMAEEYRQQVNQVIDAFMGNAGGTNESD